MSIYTPKSGFYRSGEISIATYNPKVGGSTISAPTAPTVSSRALNITEAEVRNGRLFNVQYSTPGTQRTVKASYLSLDIYGNLVSTALTTGVNITPSATDNALEVLFANVPANALYICIFIDDQIAQIVPTPPATRLNSVVVASFGVHVLYEPSPRAVKSQDVLDMGTGYNPIEVRRDELGFTTGELTHTIDFTQIDVPINGMPNELITTRSSQMISATFVAPLTRLQALVSGGTHVDLCGDAVEMTQFGFKSGNCSGNRVFDLIFPGNECYQQLNGLFYGKVIHGEASQAINYSSESVSHMPFTLKEAASPYFLGNHSLTLLKV